MKQVTFGSLAVGSEFVWKGNTYQKTNKIRISCCKFHNGCTLEAPIVKHAFQDSEIVEVKDTSDGETT